MLSIFSKLTLIKIIIKKPYLTTVFVFWGCLLFQLGKKPRKKKNLSHGDGVCTVIFQSERDVYSMSKSSLANAMQIIKRLLLDGILSFSRRCRCTKSEKTKRLVFIFSNSEGIFNIRHKFVENWLYTAKMQNFISFHRFF